MTAGKALTGFGNLKGVARALGVGIGDVGDADGGKVGSWTGDEDFESVGEEEGDNVGFEKCQCESEEEGAFGAEVAEFDEEDEKERKKGDKGEEERVGNYIGEVGRLEEGVEEGN